MLKYKKIIILVIILLLGIVAYCFIDLNEDNEEIDYKNVVFQEPLESQNILIEEKEYIKIHIAGQVKNPGIIELEKGERISDAIIKAGGITESANLEDVNLAYSLEDGQKLYIPSIEEKDVEYITEKNGDNIIEENNFSKKDQIVNINSAELAELETIPGVGPSMAQKIIDYRNENGNFKTIDDLKNVSGIGEKKFESLKSYISVK